MNIDDHASFKDIAETNSTKISDKILIVHDVVSSIDSGMNVVTI